MRRIGKENDNTEKEQGSVRRKRVWKADGASGLGEAGDRDEKAKRRDDEMDCGKGPAKSKVKMGKGKQPAARSERNSAIEKIKQLPAPPSHIPFQGLFPPHKAQAIGSAAGCVNPYELFALFFSPEQVSLLAKHTNMYATSHTAGLASLSHAFIRKWYPTCSSELLVYFAMLIYMGLSKAASPKLFWRRINGILPEPMMQMSYTRFQQLKRYFHISEPSELPIQRKEWWKKLEPLNSSLRDLAKECYLPATNVAIDEMMIRFLGRSAHTIKMPNKPIGLGYKVFAVCNAGYTYDWELTSHMEGFATSVQQKKPYLLSPTSSAVLQMLVKLPYQSYFFTVYMDNYFSNIRLFARLLDHGIGACGTVLTSSKDFPDIQNISKDKAVGLLEWNFATGVVVHEIRDTPKNAKAEQPSQWGIPPVMVFLWQDNSTVHLLSTVHNLDSSAWVEKMRWKPRETSTNAAAARRPFGENQHRKLLPISKIDDDYNQYMGSVDIADQLRSYFSTQRVARRNWQPFFYWLLDIAIINSYRLARTNGSQISHRDFRSSLVTSLLTTAQTSLSSTSSPTVFNKPKFKFLYRQHKRFRLRNPIRQSYITKNTLEPKPVGRFGTLQGGHIRVHTVKVTRGWCLWCRWRRKQGGPEVQIHQSSFQCQRCHVVLCRSCFPLFHGIGQS